MNIIEKAFRSLYPDKEFNYDAKIKYSGRFSKYNANVKYTHKTMEFGLSREWKQVDEDIRIGLLQSLMTKIFRTKKTTTNIDLYNIFIRNVHMAIPKTQTHPVLEDSFNRVNEYYFLGIVEKPNLRWGQHSTTKLGSYDYHSDAISISRIFKDAQQQFLDYIMFHEMLHKLHKFRVKNGRSIHHSTLFRKREKDFENSREIEKELSSYIRKWKYTNHGKSDKVSQKTPIWRKRFRLF